MTFYGKSYYSAYELLASAIYFPAKGQSSVDYSTVVRPVQEARVSALLDTSSYHCEIAVFHLMSSSDAQIIRRVQVAFLFVFLFIVHRLCVS